MNSQADSRTPVCVSVRVSFGLHVKVIVFVSFVDFLRQTSIQQRGLKQARTFSTFNAFFTYSAHKRETSALP